MSINHPRMRTPRNHNPLGACCHLPMSAGARINSHSRQDLVNFIKVNIQRLDPDIVKRFTELKAAMAIGREPTDYYLKLLVEIIDDLFFGGRMRGHCRVRFSSDTETETGLLGVTNPVSTRGQSDIIIFTRDSMRRKEDRPTMLRGYTASLLHEFIHAYLCLYECESCLVKEQGEGTKDPGHGYPWNEISDNIAKACRENLGLPLNLRFGTDARSPNRR